MSPRATESFQTAADFEAWYAANSNVTVAWLHRKGRYGKPCDCGDDSCTGWQMAYKDEKMQAALDGRPPRTVK